MKKIYEMALRSVLATNPEQGDTPAEPRTESALVYDALRRGLISGEVPAGQRLRIQQSCEAYQCGAIPFREALNRLTADGLVVHSEQRGFAAAPVSVADVLDLCRLRVWLTTAALAESLRHGGVEWEEGVLLAYHRLRKLPRYAGEGAGSGINPAYQTPHRAFHDALLAGCDSPWTLRLHAQLFDHAERHRNLARVLRREDPDAEHLALVQAALARDVERTVHLATLHIEAVAKTVADAMSGSERAASPTRSAARPRMRR